MSRREAGPSGERREVAWGGGRERNCESHPSIAAIRDCNCESHPSIAAIRSNLAVEPKPRQYRGAEMAGGALTVAVYGATGGTGRRLVPLLLAAGHRVRVLARTPAKVEGAEGSADLEVLQGDATDAAAVARAAEGADVLVSCLGNKPARYPLIMSRAFRHILDVAGRKGAKCLFLTTASWASLLFKIYLAFFVSRHAWPYVSDIQKADEMVLAHTGSPWVLVRPNSLADGPGTEGGARPYQAPRGTLKQPAVDRQDVARFLADCVTSKEWDNKAVSLQGGLRGGCVSYRGQDYELQKVELVQANGEVVAVPEDIVKQISGSRN